MKYILALIFLLFLADGVKAQRIYSDSISVNFFMLDECRISQSITGEINFVHQRFNQGPFTYHCYFSNRSSTADQIESFMKTYGLDIPYQTDYEKEMAEKYGATIAPEVVVYDEKNNQVLYRGRIDNSFARLGIRRRVVSSRDLRDALTAILYEEPIIQKETQAIGCIINPKSR